MTIIARIINRPISLKMIYCDYIKFCKSEKCLVSFRKKVATYFLTFLFLLKKKTTTKTKTNQVLFFCLQKLGHVYTLVFPGHYVSPAAGRTSTASGYAVPTFNDDAPCPAPPTPCPAEGGRSTSSGYEVSIHASSTLTPCPRHSTTESGYQIPLCQSDVAGREQLCGKLNTL